MGASVSRAGLSPGLRERQSNRHQPEGAKSVKIEQYGFIRPRSGLASTAEQAASLASQIGYPVALKIVSPDILHKTDVGGIELALDSEEAVRAAYGRIMSRAGQEVPRAQIEGSFPVDRVMNTNAMMSCMIRMPIATRPCRDKVSVFSSNAFTAKTVLEKLKAKAMRNEVGKEVQTRRGKRIDTDTEQTDRDRHVNASARLDLRLQ